MKSKLKKEFLDNMHKNPGNWHGLLYFNKKDPRLSVPKITNTGWTLNFANPWAYVIIIALISVILISQFLL